MRLATVGVSMMKSSNLDHARAVEMARFWFCKVKVGGLQGQVSLAVGHLALFG